MFCSSCGTPNEDNATSCRVCREQLIQNLPLKQTVPHPNALLLSRTWVWLALVATLALSGFGFYHHWTTEEFEITGQLLFKNESKVTPIPGAHIRAFRKPRNASLLHSRYSLLTMRQFELLVSRPGMYDKKVDAELAPLNLAPLSVMDWTWWEVQRLHNCMYAESLFSESLRNPPEVADTSTDTTGHFWLRIQRGEYFITAESEVPSSWRVEGDLLATSDTSQGLTGDAFWIIPIRVSGNMKVIAAEPDCRPGP